MPEDFVKLTQHFGLAKKEEQNTNGFLSGFFGGGGEEQGATDSSENWDEDDAWSFGDGADSMNSDVDGGPTEQGLKRKPAPPSPDFGGGGGPENELNDARNTANGSPPVTSLSLLMRSTIQKLCVELLEKYKFYYCVPEAGAASAGTSGAAGAPIRNDYEKLRMSERERLAARRNYRPVSVTGVRWQAPPPPAHQGADDESSDGSFEDFVSEQSTAKPLPVWKTNASVLFASSKSGEKRFDRLLRKGSGRGPDEHDVFGDGARDERWKRAWRADVRDVQVIFEHSARHAYPGWRGSWRASLTPTRRERTAMEKILRLLALEVWNNRNDIGLSSLWETVPGEISERYFGREQVLLRLLSEKCKTAAQYAMLRDLQRENVVAFFEACTKRRADFVPFVVLRYLQRKAERAKRVLDELGSVGREWKRQQALKNGELFEEEDDGEQEMVKKKIVLASADSDVPPYEKMPPPIWFPQVKVWWKLEDVY